MIEFNISFPIFLGMNSLLLISIILNQNDTSKDSLKSQNLNSQSQQNPLENFTWFLIFSQFILLLITIKVF